MLLFLILANYKNKRRNLMQTKILYNQSLPSFTYIVKQYRKCKLTVWLKVNLEVTLEVKFFYFWMWHILLTVVFLEMLFVS